MGQKRKNPEDWRKDHRDLEVVDFSPRIWERHLTWKGHSLCIQQQHRKLFACYVLHFCLPKDVVLKPTAQCSLKPSIIVRRLQTGKQGTHPAELVTNYIAKLGHCSEHCDFSLSLDSMLCDRLACGVRAKAVQWHVLAESKFTLMGDKAIAAAYVHHETKKIGAMPNQVCHVRKNVVANAKPALRLKDGKMKPEDNKWLT